MWIQGSRSGPPASSSSTLCLPSALSRLASTQPAEPAPTMMKSPSAGLSTALLPWCSRDSHRSEPPRRQDAKVKSTTLRAGQSCAAGLTVLAPWRLGGLLLLGRWVARDQGDEGDREHVAPGGGAVGVLVDGREHLARARLPQRQYQASAGLELRKECGRDLRRRGGD